MRLLTARQAEVLWRRLGGESLTSIAEQLRISRETAREQLKNAYHRIGVTSLAHAALAIGS